MLKNTTGDFARIFGQNGNVASGAVPEKAELPKAQIWMNIGYPVETGNTEQPTMFVSMPTGIAIDTMEPIAVTSRNPLFAQFQAARNDLLRQVQEKAAQLAPGEEVIIDLAIQLRRVADPVEAPAADASNPFARSLSLTAKAEDEPAETTKGK